MLILSSPLTSDRDRLRRRLLAFAGLSFLLTGLLAAASFVVIALAAFGVLLLVMLAAVGISLLRRLRIGQRLRAVLTSTALAFRALKLRLHGLAIRRRAQRLGIGAREAASRAPGRANDILARVVWSYAIAVYRLRMRAAHALRPDGTLATSLARLQFRPAGRSHEALKLNELGARLRREGAHEEAVEQHRAALAIVRDLGDEQAEALTLNNLALALAQAGAVAEAVQHLEQALVLLHKLGDEEHEWRVLANLGIVHRRQGHSEEAVNLLHEALDRLPPESPAYGQVEKELRRAS